jgi:hypothetical protein
MSDNEISRRGVMGVLAAASLGKMSSVGGAESIDTAQDEVTPESDHLADYANRAGRIDIDGLNQAIDDWGNGVISSAERDDVVQAWNLGTRVVDKTVIQWDSNINEPTTWETDPNDEGLNESVVYQITSDIAVNAELTIKPGVVIEFQQGTSLNVNSGPILAQAESAEEIFMTATVARRGWWDGVYVSSGDLQNTLENVRIEYAGRENYRGCLEIDGGSIAVTGCTLRYSGEYGMYQTSGGTLTDTGDNVYANNREAGVRTTTSNAHQLSSSSEHNDNDRNYAFVVGNTASDTGADEETRNWENLQVPYRLQGSHYINSMTMTVDPGTTFEFTQASDLNFLGGSRIAIEGSDQEPITFTGTDEIRGWWNGIYLNEATDSENRFRHCIFEYGANNWDANLDVASGGTDSGAVELQNCTFRNAGGFGLVVGNSGSIENCQNNTYTGNADGAARIRTNDVESLSDTSDFTGNDKDYVLVLDDGIGGSGRDEDVRTWDNINVPYRMNGYHNINGVELVINPGATFEFTESAGLQFDSDTRINISGFIDETEEVDEITFTATQKDRGWWRGIYLNEATDQENLMEYVIVEYAGANDWPGGVDVASGGTDSGYLQFSNCTFRNCERFGVNVGNSGTVENLSGNTYTLNKEGAMRIRTNDMESLSASSDFTGNDNDYVLVLDDGINGDGSGSDSRTWDAINVPYRMNGYHNVNNVVLNVDPGATFEFTENAGLQFDGGSVFIIQGEEGNPITFTGTDETRGWWRGIYLNETESRQNRLEYVVIEYGGNSWSAQLDIASGGTDAGQIEEISNCTFQNADGYGIVFGNDSNVNEMSNNTYTGNVDGAVLTRTENAHQISGTSDFTGNDNDRVLVRSATINSGNVPSGQEGVTWDNINVPYEMQMGAHDSNVPLTIEAGATLEFQEESRLRFNGTDAQIDITGEPDNEITLTATQQGRNSEIKGWWDGIYTNEATSAVNRLEHTTVEWAGRADALAGAVDIASGGTDDGYLEVRNCTIRKSQSIGVYAQNLASVNDDVCEVNTFQDNDADDCFIDN